MTDAYITVCRTSCEERIINRSRFIGYASPCSSEEEALGFLQEIRDNHKTATHHCYAYIIGSNSGIMRYSDDGEPGGTAGLPIMDVMKCRQVVNCCVVVVRYFGGVLLGTGGLVRAYTQSAQAALEASGVARMELTAEELCEVPYPVWDKFRYAAGQMPVKISGIEYGSSICFHLQYRVSDGENLLSSLMEAADRKLVHIPVEETYIAWEI